MSAKGVFMIFLFLLLGFSLWFLSQNLPGTPEQLNVSIPTISIPLTENISSEVTQFYPNMRFPDRRISYYISPECSKERSEEMLTALALLENATGLLRFYPKPNDNAEIFVSCSEKIQSDEAGLFVAGEGGPRKILDTGLYYVIYQGKIMLRKTSNCKNGFPVIALHELLHVLGFNHTANEHSIMYPLYGCDKELDEEIVARLKELYSQDSLPDLTFMNVNAVKKGRYLDFTVQIKNQGLKKSQATKLAIYADDKLVDNIDIKGEEVGYILILEIKNMRLPSRNLRTIRFVIDPDNEVAEIIEENNEAFLNVEK